MNINNVEIKIVPTAGQSESSGIQAPLVGEDLYSVQDKFRGRVKTMLSRAYERQLEVFEMSGLDNRFLNFPIVGAAKIVAQEVMRILKKSDLPFQEIQVLVPGGELLNQYKNVFEGYVRHVLEDLGPEPYPTVDLVIEVKDGLVLIERSNPPYGWALPGGFIDAGEQARAAAIREAKEETDLDLDQIREFKIYDQPGRDPRFETSTTVFIAKGVGVPQFGDDAQGLQVIAYEKLMNRKYAFDHKEIIRDYLEDKRGVTE